MRPYSGLISFLLSLFLLMPPFGFITQAEIPLAHPADPPPTVVEPFMIKISDGLLTVEVTRSPLQSLLEEIARKSGIRIFLAAPTDRPVTAAFHNVPVDEGLRRILKGRSFAFLYPRALSDGKKPSISTPEEVYVLIGAGTGMSLGERFFPEANMVVGDKGVFIEAKIVSDGATMDVRVRAEAGESEVRPLDTEEASEAFAQVPSDEENRHLRKRALETLGRTWHVDAIEPLTQYLLDDDDPSLREAAAKAMGRTFSANAVDPLGLALFGDRDSFVREAAARALGETWSEAAVAPLIRALLADPSRYVREAAAQALGEIRSPNGVQPLIEALADKDGSVRESAVLALGVIGSPQAAEALKETSLNDDDIWVRETAAELVVKAIR